MKTVYRVLAYLVAAEVVVQAMAIVYAIFGLGKWVDGGGVLDKSVMEGEGSPFPEISGLVLHGMNGMIVVPSIALILLICSFFTGIPRAARWAGLVLLLVVIQVNLGFAGHEMPAIGALHGLNALALFTTALYTARRARVPAAAPAAPADARVGTPA
jgi:hypothetical protein